MSDSLGRVVVTGGAGFIGCALAGALLERADHWVAVDSLHPQVHPRSERPAALPRDVELVVGDVASAETWDRVLADGGADVVLHLAAETGTAQSLHEATRHGETNVVGTTRMLDAISRAGHLPRRILLTSSRAVYGEGTWRRPDGTRFQPGPRTHAQLAAGLWDFPDSTFLPCSAEVTPPDPSSVYGATKLAQENLLSAWCGSHDTPLTVLRLQNVIGPGQSLDNPYTGILVLFARWAREGRSIPVYEDGLVTRDFVHVDDVVGAVAAALDGSATPSGHRVQPLDVGSGVRTTLLELTALVADQYGAPEPTVTGQFRDGDVRHAGCDVTATTDALGWRPERDLRAAVTDVLQWVDHRLPT